MSEINSTTARNNFFKVMEEVIDSHEPIIQLIPLSRN